MFVCFIFLESKVLFVCLFVFYKYVNWMVSKSDQASVLSEVTQLEQTKTKYPLN